jgi:hypothetical protein
VAKDSTIKFVKDPLAHSLKEFKRLRKIAREDLQKERRAFYDRIESIVRRRVIFSGNFGDIGEGKGFPVIARVDVKKPGEIRVCIYHLKSVPEDEVGRTQNEICKERSLWFKPLLDKDGKKRHLCLEKAGGKKWRVKESNHFQTVIIKTKVVPNQAELDRLFDPEPLKHIG